MEAECHGEGPWGGEVAEGGRRLHTAPPGPQSSDMVRMCVEGERGGKMRMCREGEEVGW